jgi:acetate---CoA ligase (ADP-forming)
VLVTPMAPAGVELIVGAATDPTFGPVLTLGAGGTGVEVQEDVTFRAIPATPLECREMLDELALAPVLDGFRGREPVDRERLVELLLAVSRFVEQERDVVELDLNPVVAHARGLELVDVRVVLRDRALGTEQHDAADGDEHEPAAPQHATAR